MSRLATVAALLVASVAASPAPRDGAELIRAMHHAYAGKWYGAVTFVQMTAYPNARVETWYESLALPGRLRIDVAPLASRQATIFRADSAYQFRGGQLRSADAMVHPLLLLAFDVYAQSPDISISKLRELGFDLARLREDTWQGRRHWIVGALVGDSVSREFWVEQERLLVSRLVQAAPRAGVPGKRDVAEIHFTDHRPLGGGWIATKVTYLNNGEKVESESYEDIQLRDSLPDALFDPGVWQRPAWVPQ